MIHMVAVEYLNSLPLLEGIRATKLIEKITLHLASPAQCAEIYEEGKADIALMPTGALYKLPSYRIITDYCIGSDGEVMTVALFSNHPLHEIRYIQLDPASRTSNLLLQLIADQHWKLKDVVFTFDNQDRPATAHLVIGDRAFQWNDTTKYKFDLGMAWKEFLQLPFVYAVWIAKNELDPGIIQHLNQAFRYGIFHIGAAVRKNKTAVSAEQLASYYANNISYHFDDRKRVGLQRFLEMARRYYGKTIFPSYA